MSFVEKPDGVRLRVCDRGAGSRAFVLVHGWKQSHRLWDPVIARLARGHRVIAFDLRGMGESDKPNSDYSFEELAGDLGYLLERLELEDVTLVGWSMGCSVSLQLLDAGAPRVGRLVLVNGPLRLTRTADFPHGLTDEELAGYVDDVERHWPLRERRFLADSLLEAKPEHVDWLVSIALQTPLDIAVRLVRAQAQLDQRAIVERLRVPVLAAWSRRDPYWPVALAEWIAERAPDGRCVLFDRSAHCTPFEESDRFCETIERFAAGTLVPGSGARDPEEATL